MFQITSAFKSNYFWVPNFLVDHFFHETDAESIKLYIFMLRMAEGQDQYSPKVLASILSISEDQVLIYLKQWESRKLLKMEVNENWELTSILLTPFMEPVQPIGQSYSDVEPSSKTGYPQNDYLSNAYPNATYPSQAYPNTYTQSMVTPEPVDAYRLEVSRPFIEAPRPVESQRANDAPRGQESRQQEIRQQEMRQQEIPVQGSGFGPRPSYQPTELLNLQDEHQEYQLLLYTVRKILEKDMTHNDISILYSLHDWLQLPFEVIQALIIYCAERGKKDFNYIEALAIKLAEKGITIPEQVDAFLSPPSEKRLYEVIRELGMGGTTPTEGQRELYKKWTEVYLFSHESILKGCQIASTKSNRTSFQYLDAILTNWYKEGVIDGKPAPKNPNLNQDGSTQGNGNNQSNAYGSNGGSSNNQGNGQGNSNGQGNNSNYQNNNYRNNKGRNNNAFHNFPNASTDKYAEAIEKLINEDFEKYE